MEAAGIVFFMFAAVVALLVLLHRAD